ncbi:MAG: DUF3833 family protein [Pseudomonadota bacterium]
MKPMMVAVLCLLSLTGCMSMTVQDFADKKPHFAVEEYFAGKTKAWGIFQDRFGNVETPVRRRSRRTPGRRCVRPDRGLPL